MADRERNTRHGTRDHHYALELSAQMARATQRGARHLLVNARDLGCSFGDFTSEGYVSMECNDAMAHALGDGDLILVPRSNGAGMTVRYLLPRTVA